MVNGIKLSSLALHMVPTSLHVCLFVPLLPLHVEF